MCIMFQIDQYHPIIFKYFEAEHLYSKYKSWKIKLPIELSWLLWTTGWSQKIILAEIIII